MIMLMGIGLITGCAPKNLSNDEHIKRITERVEQRFMTSESEYAGYYNDFTVEILYNYKDEPVYYLVEFNPDGFIYGRIDRNKYYYDVASTFYKGSKWEEDKKIYYKESCGWSTQEEGEEFVLHYKSHFYVEGITDERKYICIISSIKDGLPFGVIHVAVKRDGAFIDLISGKDDYSLNRISGDDFLRKSRRNWHLL